MLGKYFIVPKFCILNIPRITTAFRGVSTLYFILFSQFHIFPLYRNSVLTTLPMIWKIFVDITSAGMTMAFPIFFFTFFWLILFSYLTNYFNLHCIFKKHDIYDTDEIECNWYFGTKQLEAKSNDSSNFPYMIP